MLYVGDRMVMGKWIYLLESIRILIKNRLTMIALLQANQVILHHMHNQNQIMKLILGSMNMKMIKI